VYLVVFEAAAFLTPQKKSYLEASGIMLKRSWQQSQAHIRKRSLINLPSTLIKAWQK